MSVEETTMYAIAEQLWFWDSANLYIGVMSAKYWDNLPESERQDWYDKAVLLFDKIEPVWLARTAENRRELQRKAWDEGFDEASDDLGRAAEMASYGESTNPYLRRAE